MTRNHQKVLQNQRLFAMIKAYAKLLDYVGATKI